MNLVEFDWYGLMAALFFGAGLNYVRYFLMAGIAYKVFFHKPPKWTLSQKIAKKKRPEGQNKRDIYYSLISIGIFGLVGVITYFMGKAGWTKAYSDVNDYGWTWWFVSIPVMLVIHDAYFYWTHFLMHNRRLFPLFHKIHHLSKDPTPLTSYAFHPFEALVSAGILPLLVILLPLHQGAILVFVTIQFGFNVLGHLGHELYPTWMIHSPLGKILNTTTHHHQHHQTFHYNYGLYFNWWDRLLKTNHPDYKKTFIEQSKVSLIGNDEKVRGVIPSRLH